MEYHSAGVSETMLVVILVHTRSVLPGTSAETTQIVMTHKAYLVEDEKWTRYLLDSVSR